MITPVELNDILDIIPKRTIKFNISGKKFECLEETLMPVRDTALGRTLYDDQLLVKDEKGYYLFDRDARYFAFLLDFLRTKKMSWPNESTYSEKMEKEFEYFGIRWNLFD